MVAIIVLSPIVLSPCNCNYIHTVATYTLYMYMARQIRKPSNKEAFLYIRLNRHYYCTHSFTCEVNGFVQIRAVHSRAGPTIPRLVR